MKYALILIGILTKKQGVSSLCTALSLASFGMHWFGNVELSTFLYIIWIHKIKFMTSWPIIVVGWGYDLLEVMIKGKG